MTVQDRDAFQSEGRAAEVYRKAAEIILQKGYDATSVSDIAEALGITKAGLYHYIHGKTQLLFDCAERTFHPRRMTPSGARTSKSSRLAPMSENSASASVTSVAVISLRGG